MDNSDHRNGFCAHPGLPRTNKPAPKVWLEGHWWNTSVNWFDMAPTRRLVLPEYVPEVAAGVPAPIVLSDWKIKAIRVCVVVVRRGSINRLLFRALAIDPSRWMDGHWLAPGNCRGEWVAGPRFPAEKWRADHPSVFAQIEADYEKWGAKIVGGKQERLL